MQTEPCCQRIEKEELCDGRDEEEQTSIPSHGSASDEIARHCKHCTERGVTKLHESGTALAEATRVPVSKVEELVAAHVKYVARQVQGRSFITTSCRELISQLITKKE